VFEIVVRNLVKNAAEHNDADETAETGQNR